MAKEAVADKRVHKLAVQLEVVQVQQEEQQPVNKKIRLNILKRKIADVSGKTRLFLETLNFHFR